MLNLISKLFASGTRVAAQPQATITSGDLITQCAGGSNLVDGLPTWHYAESKKNDLQFMLRCCEAEMLTMQKADFVAAPYYFERAAILLRKAKEYEREILVCESYRDGINRFYLDKDLANLADVRKGPFFRGLTKRIGKAQQLLTKHQCQPVKVGSK